MMMASKRRGVTSLCEEKSVERTSAPGDTEKPGGPLTVIDTPGIPDPRRKSKSDPSKFEKIRTLEFYNDIVLTMRRIGGLNSLVFLLQYSKDRAQVQRDFETHRILFEQFGDLTCPKAFICQYDINTDLTEKSQEREMKKVTAWVQDLVAKVKGTSVVFFVNNRQSQREQLFAVRQTLDKMLFIPISEMSIRTTDELQESAGRLVNDNTRREELEKKKLVLMREIEEVRGSCEDLQRKAKDARGHGAFWGGVIAVGSLVVDMASGMVLIGAVAGVGAALGGAVRQAADVSATIFERMIIQLEDKARDIDSQVKEIEMELNGDDTIKVKALERDVYTLGELEKLDTLCAIP